MIKCEKCGAELPEGSRFCNYCGSDITEPSEEELVEDAADMSPKSESTKAPSISPANRKAFAFVIAVIVGIIIASRNGSLDKLVDWVSPGSSAVTVTVTDMTSLPSDPLGGRLLQGVALDIKVSNNSGKTIKGVSGTLTIKDMFNKEIKEEKIDITGYDIAPHSYVILQDYYIHTNTFIKDDMALYDAAYKDLTFNYKATDVVYK